jgi:beta-glucanase (GH16 family)
VTAQLSHIGRMFAPAALCLAAQACNTPPPPDTGDDWPGPKGTFREVFRDEFDGPAGSGPDESHWNVLDREFGHNQELDYNTTDRKNSYLDGQSNLVIQALSEHYQLPNGRVSSQPYTSARLETDGKVEQKYGRIEARIRLPAGKGLWPAFWLLGKSIHTVGWPDCGEVDVLELAGSKPAQINGTMHGPGYSGIEAPTGRYALESGIFADDFHIFTMEWNGEGMRWLVDGQQYYSRTRARIEDDGVQWVFDEPMFIILNLAVGGFYDGEPDSSTPFPSQMVIDYVSVSALDE